MRSLLIGILLLTLGACGDEHGDVHVMFTVAPPASATAGTAFDVSWQVHNESHDDLHHSEVRVCDGGDVLDCGLGDTSTYTSVTGTLSGDTYTASVALDTAAIYTVIAWCHVGEDPHVSDAYTVDAQ